jgi:hypothetical protein
LAAECGFCIKPRKLPRKLRGYHIRQNYIQPALKQGLVELIYPDIPNHPQQKYRLTAKAERLKNKIKIFPP